MLKSESLRRELTSFLGCKIQPGSVSYDVIEQHEEGGYTRSLIQIQSQDEDLIPAYLLVPEGEGPFPAVQVHHQHAGQRHLGKSEVCGLVGDEWQAFGPTLARAGMVVLAADSISFEDRRKDVSGVEPDDTDVMQHFNEMCYRLVRGDTLMRKVLDDAACGLNMLCNHPAVDERRVGVLGHSYGGNTILFQAALDERIQFACASGAAGSYKAKMENFIGLEMALVIPGFAEQYDVGDLLSCIAPRRLLLVSAREDPHSLDAPALAQEASKVYEALGSPSRLEHQRYKGGHALDQGRFEEITDWVVSKGNELVD